MGTAYSGLFTIVGLLWSVSKCSGQAVWVSQFGSPADEIGYEVTADATGAAYMAASASGNYGMLVNPGGLDGLAQKVSLAGSSTWYRSQSTSSNDISVAIVASGSAIYVAGYTKGALTPQPSEGGDDAFVRKYDQNGTELWTRQFGSFANDQIQGISVNGNDLYVVGYTEGDLAGSPGGTDAFLRKYDIQGNHRWTRQFGTSRRDVGNGVWAGASGVYVSGSTAGSLVGVSAGSQDIFVRKYDTDGNVIWTRQLGGSDWDEAGGIAGTSSAVYLTGTAINLPTYTSPGEKDSFVRKYDLNGGSLWTRVFGSSSSDVARGIAADGSGVYVVGFTDGTLPGQTSSGSRDAFVRKLNSSGSTLWTRQFGSSQTQAYGVAIGGANLYISGTTRGRLAGTKDAVGSDIFIRKMDLAGTTGWTFQGSGGGDDRVTGVTRAGGAAFVVGKTSGSFPLTPAPAGVFLRRYNDATGQPVWTRQFSIPNLAAGVALTTDGSSLVLAGAGVLKKFSLTGDETWSTDVGGQSSGLAASGSGIYVAGTFNSNAVLAKYDAAGAAIWSRVVSTSAHDYGNAVAFNSSGSYLVGLTHGALPGNTAKGQGDAFVRKYDLNGTELWTRQFGSSSFDQATSIAVDASNVYVAGKANGLLPDQIDPPTVSTGQYPGGFVRTYDRNGNHLWTRQLPSNFDVIAVAADAGGVYLAGKAPGGKRAKFFVKKFGLDGTPLWSTTYVYVDRGPVSDATWFTGFLVTTSGMYTGGYTYGRVSTYSSGSYYGGSSAGGWDAFLEKARHVGGNTPAGADVWIGLGSVSLELERVFTGGTTNVTTSNAETAGADFAFRGTYYDVTSDANIFSGSNVFCLAYDDSVIPSFEEPDLKLYQKTGTGWQEATKDGYPQTDRNRICADFSSISP